jgi:signal transduction histidine kinase
MPSPRFLPPFLRAVPPGDAAAEAAFTAYAAALTAQLGMFTAALMIVFTAAYWPLDGLVLPDARFSEAFATLRLRALAIEILAIVVLTPAVARRFALPIAAVLYAALLGSFGLSLGALGGADLSWLGDAWLGVVPIAFIPFRLGARVLATTFAGAMLPALFFLPYPENLAAPAAAGQLAFGVFAILFTIAIGEVIYRVMRRDFFQNRALDRANAELTALSGSLSARVAEQTRELRALAGHLDAALEAERRRIARDLHDDLGQSLTAMRYTVARLEDRLPPDAEAARDLTDDLSALLDGTAQTVRGFLSELRPRVLDDCGLVAAAEWLVGRLRETTGLVCTLRVEPRLAAEPGVLDAQTALVLFRVLQEATTNVSKHASARSVAVTLGLEGSDCVLRVEDDGVGFDSAASTPGFGLLGLRERLQARGGALSVDTSPGGGTRLVASLPVSGPTPTPVHPGGG